MAKAFKLERWIYGLYRPSRPSMDKRRGGDAIKLRMIQIRYNVSYLTLVFSHDDGDGRASMYFVQTNEPRSVFLTTVPLYTVRYLPATGS